MIVSVARWVSLIAAFVMGAVAEHHLAVQVGIADPTAWLLPLILDIWGFAAFATGRKWHVMGALATMFGAQAVSHLLTLGDAPWHMVTLSVAVSALAPSVSLACHRLGDTHGVTVTAEAGTATAAVTAVTVTPVTPAATVPAATGTVTAATVTAATPAATVTPTSGTVSAELVTIEPTAVTPPARKRSKTEIAAEGTALLEANGYNRTAAAAALGISRAWLKRCIDDTAAQTA